ncbi:MAG TPA: hypothetical protein VMU72_08585 [Gaiellaceae bacterium]|nr:hypothetical protein [Gaiellaceae bacterium]
MDFGVTVLSDPPFSRRLELIQLAEEHGLGYAWTQAFGDEIIPDFSGVAA